MVVGTPFERVGIDLTGPHPKSKSGKVYILTCLDHFTKWAEAVALPNKETITVAKALVNNIFPRIGCPLQILSDLGKEFESELFRELCARLEVDKIRTTAYKASTNGASERFHRTLNSMLGKVVDEHQRDWCEYLPQIMAAYRSAKHEATGFTPNLLVYGRELSAPIDLVLGRPEGPQYHSVDDFVEQKLSIIETAHQMARESLHAASSRSKRCYDAHVKERQFQSNTWVWYYSPRKFVGRSPKWQRNFSGPFLIIRQLGPVLFVIQRSKRSKELVVHADKLKPYLGETIPSWLNHESTDVEQPHKTAPTAMHEADVLSTQPNNLVENRNSLRANDQLSVHEDSCDATEQEHHTDAGISTGQPMGSCRTDGVDQVEEPSRNIECREDQNAGSIPSKRALPPRNRRKPLRYRAVNQWRN